ncbi:GntR family transcriptional regulator [Saccharopolyspora taberi]|uniref:GntR family transcriptional regulator n=1 Tax=Saccharopolyspora taberi TaxID=60895 RepID=A0ABN3VB36_9PSEU
MPAVPDDTHTEQLAVPLAASALSGIRRLSAVDTVRARISLAVDLGLLKPGEWLPGNDKIAAALEVSEITVRRALISLCKDGVLERRRGRGGGTRVVDAPPRSAVRETQEYRAVAAEVHGLIDQRLVLECGIAHLAARNADDTDIDRLDQLTQRMDQAADWAEFHSLDETFHLTIAAVTGLDAIQQNYARLLRELYRYYLPYPMQYLRGSNCEHHELVDALRRRDPASAADIAQRHVAVLHQDMFVGL